MRIILIIIIMLAVVAPVHAQDGGYICGQYIYPMDWTGDWSSSTDGTAILGSTSLFPREYRYVSHSNAFLVEVIEVVNVRLPYDPLLNIYPDGDAAFSADQNSVYYVNGTGLRVQTQFASFRIRVSSCTATPPTPTPTPILILPTVPSGTSVPLFPSWLCGTPTPFTTEAAGASLSAFSEQPPPPPPPLPPSLPFTGTVTPVPAFPALLGMCQHFDGGITNTLDLQLQYLDEIATSVVAIENSINFVARRCYVVIPELAVPPIPGVTDGLDVFGGLQVCIRYYTWVMRYGDLYLSSIVLSLLTFAALWAVFVMFRKG